jgi:hypothetical protein
VYYSTSGTVRVEEFDGGRIFHLDGRHAPALHAYMEWSAAAFEEKFGRPIGPNDPLFWDPAAAEPRPLSAEQMKHDMAASLRRKGFDEAYIFAFEVTGIMLSEENLPLVSPEDRDAFYAAQDFYRRLGPVVRSMAGL